MTAPRLAAIRFTKKHLLELSKPERELLLRVGLALNDLALFQRVWTAFFYREPKSQISLEAQAIHEISTLLVFLGKLNEACEIFRKFFLESPVGRDYPPAFKPEGRHAVNRLKQLLGKDNLLTKLRDSFAFHYHEADLSPFIERVPDEHKLAIYLGDPDGNTMNQYAAEVLYHSLLAVIQAPHPKAAIKRVHDFAGEVASQLKSWGAAVQVVAIRKMLGKQSRLNFIKIQHDEHLPQDETRFPFFMSAPAKQTSPPERRQGAVRRRIRRSK